jgi:flagellar motor protein MotB
MAPQRRSRSLDEDNHWIGYTDLLSNTLLVLLLTVAITTVAKASRERPPLIRLTEEQSFRFQTGSYNLSPVFIASLDQRIPEITETIRKYGIDTIEVIGHTDGQPSPGLSNLDLLLANPARASALPGYRAGSNTDLGLLRAIAVANYLRQNIAGKDRANLVIRPYSAGSLIDGEGRYAPADTRDRADRRRIEIRFTRKDQA